MNVEFGLYLGPLKHYCDYDESESAVVVGDDDCDCDYEKTVLLKATESQVTKFLAKRLQADTVS